MSHSFSRLDVFIRLATGELASAWVEEEVDDLTGACIFCKPRMFLTMPGSRGHSRLGFWDQGDADDQVSGENR